MQLPRVKRFLLAAAAATFVLFAAESRADVVKLTGGRSMRVVAVMTRGAETTLALPSGGTVIVPTSSIESVQTEFVAADLCEASPYRCQDRAMLMLRHAQAVALRAATPTNAHP
jgi:hypothetical protein